MFTTVGTVEAKKFYIIGPRLSKDVDSESMLVDVVWDAKS